MAHESLIPWRFIRFPNDSETRTELSRRESYNWRSMTNTVMSCMTTRHLGRKFEGFPSPWDLTWCIPGTSDYQFFSGVSIDVEYIIFKNQIQLVYDARLFFSRRISHKESQLWLGATSRRFVKNREPGIKSSPASVASWSDLSNSFKYFDITIHHSYHQNNHQ